MNDLDDFNLQSKKTTFSFKPNISYNFSKYVNGTVFYKLDGYTTRTYTTKHITIRHMDTTKHHIIQHTCFI